MTRFSSLDRLYGSGTVDVLARSHVCIVGVGGVGSWAAEAFARSGIGKLTLIDADEVCLGNVNRQSHALDGTIGRSKVAVLAERLRLINPAIDVQAVAAFVTLNRLPSFTTASAGVATKLGATFTSVTITVKEFVTLTAPSLTAVAMVLVLGPDRKSVV